MIRTAAVNLDCYNAEKVLNANPDLYRVCDIAVAQDPGVAISAADREQYKKICDLLELKSHRHARYLNMAHARVRDVKEVFPDNAVPTASLSDDYFIAGSMGQPTILRPGVVIRRYDLSDDKKRARLADVFAKAYHEHPLSDFNLDGCCVPELVFSALPWRFAQTCDFLSKVRMRLPIKPTFGQSGGCELGINLAGQLHDLLPKHIDGIAGAGVSYVVFEQVAKQYDDQHLWQCVRNASRLLQASVLPILCVNPATPEDALCRKVCEATGAALAI